MERIIALNVYGNDETIERISFSRVHPNSIESYCEDINATKIDNGKWVFSKIMKENCKIKIEGKECLSIDEIDVNNSDCIEIDDIMVLNIFGSETIVENISFAAFPTYHRAIDYCKTINKIRHDDKKWNYAKILEHDEDYYLKRPEAKDFNELERIYPEVFFIIAHAFDPYDFPLMYAISDNDKIIDLIVGWGENKGVDENYPKFVHERASSKKHDEILLAKKQIMDYVMTLGFSK